MQLFSRAQFKSMLPANIISGFRSCGVSPFNPKAVLDHDPHVYKSKSPNGKLSSGSIPVVGADNL